MISPCVKGFRQSTLNLLVLIQKNHIYLCLQLWNLCFFFFYFIFCINVPQHQNTENHWFGWFGLIWSATHFLHLINLLIYFVGLFGSCFGGTVIQRLCSMNGCTRMCVLHQSLHTTMLKHSSPHSSWSKITEHALHQNIHIHAPTVPTDI